MPAHIEFKHQETERFDATKGEEECVLFNMYPIFSAKKYVLLRHQCPGEGANDCEQKDRVARRGHRLERVTVFVWVHMPQRGFVCDSRST